MTVRKTIRLQRMVAGALLLLPLTGIAPAAQAQTTPSPVDLRLIAPQNELVVQGTGDVQVTPDTARMDFSVTTDAIDSSQAVQQNAVQTDAVLKAIRAAGIPDKDVCTVGFNLNARNDYDNGKTIFRGYTATNTVRVTTRKIADAGKVIDAATKAGANGVGGIQLMLNDDDQKKMMEQAMTGAVADANRKAKILARAASLTGLRIVSISESGDTSGPRPLPMYAMARAATSTPIQAGEQTLSASVTIRYTYNSAPQNP